MSPPEIHELTLPDSLAGERLDVALAQLLPQYSRARLQRWIDDGRVLIEGVAPARREPVRAGAQVRVEAEFIADERVSAGDPAVPFRVVHRDAAIFVIDKPAGLVVHPGAGISEGTLQNALLQLDPKLAQVPRAGIVHRLDKDTSGLLVVARTPGLELHARQGMHAKALLDAVVRHRPATIAAHGHAGTLRAMSTNRLIDGASAGHHALTKREVLTLDLVRRERAHQRGLRERRARDDEQSRGVLVEPVHDAGARHSRELRIEREQGVLQGARSYARTRVHHKACRLVDHQHRRIAMHDAKGHRRLAGLDAGLGRELGAHTHPLTTDRKLASRGRCAFEQHPPLENPALQARPRVLRQQSRQHDIQPLARPFSGQRQLVQLGGGLGDRLDSLFAGR